MILCGVSLTVVRPFYRMTGLPYPEIVLSHQQRGMRFALSERRAQSCGPACDRQRSV